MDTRASIRLRILVEEKRQLERPLVAAWISEKWSMLGFSGKSWSLMRERESWVERDDGLAVLDGFGSMASTAIFVLHIDVPTDFAGF
ncbi:hypothetical protein CDL15_Pgr000232 [Punica granatum]|uniref:Uncharacterized protein n=1 Tax=Punica granatum TaxID=22663 RepID=A0A218Y2K8_PUNGR|nr:hypothetical protein CDL15_Pgr000232 [Punica granatum]PKI61544.1 hypothetical protein CRG98_018040 [Punica granatum]